MQIAIHPRFHALGGPCKVLNSTCMSVNNTIAQATAAAAEFAAADLAWIKEQTQARVTRSAPAVRSSM